MRFLGLVNYFAEYVDHFADSARPLYNVLKGTGFSKRRRRGQKLIIQDWVCDGEKHNDVPGKSLRTP